MPSECIGRVLTANIFGSYLMSGYLGYNIHHVYTHLALPHSCFVQYSTKFLITAEDEVPDVGYWVGQ